MIDTGKYDYEGYGINVDSAREIPGTVNKFTTFCPRCHADRKPSHQKKRELTVWPDSGYCKCNHCGETWRMDTREWQEKKSERKKIVKKKGNGKAEKNPSGNAKGGSGTGKESGKGLFSRFNGKKSEKKSATNDDVKTDNAPEEKTSFESVQPAPENSAPETQN